MAFTFEKLIVYQKAIDFADAVCTATEQFPLLELARRRQLISETMHAELKDRLEEIARMLSGLINVLENRKV